MAWEQDIYARLETVHSNQLAMIRMLKQILQKENLEMTALTDLQAAETNLASVVSAAIADITDLSAKLAAAVAANDPVAIEAVATQLNGLATNLQNTVTPSAPGAATPASPAT